MTGNPEIIRPNQRAYAGRGWIQRRIGDRGPNEPRSFLCDADCDVTALILAAVTD